MPTTEEATRWRGQDLVDSDGDKIGKINDVYLDTDTDRPEWLAVTTGLFGSNVSFVPTAEANEHDGHIHVPYTPRRRPCRTRCQGAHRDDGDEGNAR